MLLTSSPVNEVFVMSICVKTISVLIVLLLPLIAHAQDHPGDARITDSRWHPPLNLQAQSTYEPELRFLPVRDLAPETPAPREPRNLGSQLLVQALVVTGAVVTSTAVVGAFAVVRYTDFWNDQRRGALALQSGVLWVLATGTVTGSAASWLLDPWRTTSGRMPFTQSLRFNLIYNLATIAAPSLIMSAAFSIGAATNPNEQTPIAAGFESSGLITLVLAPVVMLSSGIANTFFYEKWHTTLEPTVSSSLPDVPVPGMTRHRSRRDIVEVPTVGIKLRF